jgi:hypothetical protein
MTMNGVSNTLNLFSWLSSGITFVILFCITPIVVVLLFSTGDALPFLNYGNPFLIWLSLSFHIAHLFTYGIHISAYFSKCKLTDVRCRFILIIINNRNFCSFVRYIWYFGFECLLSSITVTWSNRRNLYVCTVFRSNFSKHTIESNYRRT